MDMDEAAAEGKVLRACLAGDPGAADRFADAYHAVVLAAVTHVLRGPVTRDPGTDGEDIVQDVFLRLFRDDARLLRTYDAARASLSTWLSLVARTTALSRLRRPRPRLLEFDPELHAPTAAPEAPPEPAAFPSGLLTPRQELVLRLLFEQNLDVEEIARVLNIEAQTVRSTKHKALSQLRRHFGAEEK